MSVDDKSRKRPNSQPSALEDGTTYYLASSVTCHPSMTVVDHHHGGSLRNAHGTGTATNQDIHTRLGCLRRRSVVPMVTFRREGASTLGTRRGTSPSTAAASISRQGMVRHDTFSTLAVTSTGILVVPGAANKHSLATPI